MDMLSKKSMSNVKYRRAEALCLVVMGGDSRSEDCEFKSQNRILDGNFFTLIWCKICNVCLKRPKINEKEAVVVQFFNKRDSDGGS